MKIIPLLLLAQSASGYILGKPTNTALLNRPNTTNTRVHSIGDNNNSNNGSEVFKLMQLPYGMGDLAPQISEETVKFHYLKHHAGYVKKLNELAQQHPDIAHMSLDELVKTSQGVIYNMSAQIWNHNFYWLGLAPNSQLENAPLTKELICRTFGSLEELKRQYTHMAAGHFGSGWVWLLYDRATDSLKLAATKDADNPMRTLMAHPLLVLDVWEHAYYIDYRNDKAKYTEAWFQKINWERVEELVKTYRIK